MSVTSQRGAISSTVESALERQPVQPSGTQQGTPDWSKVTPLHWQQHISSLVEGFTPAQDRLYWMLTLRDWLKVNLTTSNTQDKTVVQYSCADWDNGSIQANLCLMCEVAYKLCDWALIIQMHELLAKLPERQNRDTIDQQDIVEYLQLAVAFWQMGQLEKASDLLQNKLQLLPDDNPLADFHQHVQHDMQRMAFSVEDRNESDLLLMPLEEQHLSGFSWVYHDPQIAKLCNLPDFSDDEQWFNWLDRDQSNPNKQVFAVIHQQWGLIGSVSIEVHNGAGFFYYWLGQDFQGGGLGGKAVLLLLRLASQHLGMTCCYAKAFEHNVASQKAMNKIGFSALPFKVAAPNDNQIYFYRGPDKPKHQIGEELTWLARITDIDNQIIVDGDDLAV